MCFSVSHFEGKVRLITKEGNNKNLEQGKYLFRECLKCHYPVAHSPPPSSSTPCVMGEAGIDHTILRRETT